MFVLGFLCYSITLRTMAADNKIRIHSFPMDLRQHPDDHRRSVKPPDAAIFGNQIQFTALRDLEGDYKKSLDTYTIK